MTVSDGSKRRTWREPRPSFRWQAWLILLPVVALSILGFLAVRRDFASIEQEAQARATEIARVIAERLGQPLARELSGYELSGNLWRGQGIIGARGFWPETSPLPDADRKRYEQQLAQWQAEHPGWRPEDLLPVQAFLSASGELSAPRDYPVPPAPARWPTELSLDQWILWDTIARSDPTKVDASAVRSAFEEFLATEPPLPALANAEFILLAFESGRQSPDERVANLLRFARKHGAVTTESGLPLANLALARALRDANAIGLTQALFESLRDQCHERPSLLVPRLLADAEHIAAEQPADVQSAVADLRLRWEADERLRALWRQVRMTLHPADIVATNLWLDFGTNRWLAILDLATLQAATSKDDRVAVPTRVDRVRFHPKPIVRRALDRALSSMAIALPNHLVLGVVLAGEPLLDVNDPSGQSQPTMLASADGRLSLSALFYNPDDRRGHPQAGHSFEAFPTPPPFAVTVYLTDPARLYALARQRAIAIGGVTLAATFSVLIGLWAAWRSFQRQIQLNDMKSNFVASTSHELRAPIASIRLMAESLERGKIVESDRQRDYHRIIGQECRRLSSLIENVLDFSRIGQGRKRYELEPTDPGALVRQTLELMQPYASARNVTLHHAAPPTADSSQLFVDNRALQQALVNLIDNAVKHSPPSGIVTLGCEHGPSQASPATAESSVDHANHAVRPADQAFVRLWVEDQGPGIPVEDRQRIFEPFQRLGSELERDTPGVGIGLSIVQHIVDAHGGRVWVESASTQGSRFIIELPAMTTARTAATN